MNTKAKGRRNELRAAKMLEATGYDVQTAPRSTSKYAKGAHDLWERWDLVAVRSTDIRFVQVKSNRKVYGAQREFYANWDCPDNCTKEIWVFMDGHPDDPVIDIL